MDERIYEYDKSSCIYTLNFISSHQNYLKWIAMVNTGTKIVIGAQSESYNVKDLFQLDKFLCYNVFIGKLLLLSMLSMLLCIVMLYGPFVKAKIVAWFMVVPCGKYCFIFKCLNLKEYQISPKILPWLENCT